MVDFVALNEANIFLMEKGGKVKDCSVFIVETRLLKQIFYRSCNIQELELICIRCLRSYSDPFANL